MSSNKLRKVRSPWRRGPGILRLPDDDSQIATIHYQNRLKFRMFNQWQLAVLQIRCNRLLHEAIDLKCRRTLLKRAFHRWQHRVHINKCLHALCNEVRRLGLTTFQDIEAQCMRFKEFNARTAWLIFAIRYSQLKLCRRAFEIWRTRTGCSLK